MLIGQLTPFSRRLFLATLVFLTNQINLFVDLRWKYRPPFYRVSPLYQAFHGRRRTNLSEDLVRLDFHEDWDLWLFRYWMYRTNFKKRITTAEYCPVVFIKLVACCCRCDYVRVNRISLRWPILLYLLTLLINQTFVSTPHRPSTTVSSETNPLY